MEEYLLMQCVHSTIEDVSSKEQLGSDAIAGLIDHYVATKVDWHAFATLGVLGSDEIALKKHHRAYALVITTRQADGRIRLLAVLAEPTEAVVRAFFQSIPHRLRRTVTNVWCDMCDAYLSAIQAVFGADTIVIERYQLAKHYRAAADGLPKREMAGLKHERPASHYRLLKGARWYSRKKWVALAPDEREVLECLFSAAPTLRQAYD
jgi:transposase